VGLTIPGALLQVARLERMISLCTLVPASASQGRDVARAPALRCRLSAAMREQVTGVRRGTASPIRGPPACRPAAQDAEDTGRHAGAPYRCRAMTESREPHRG
jgi:hypothetical protein